MICQRNLKRCLAIVVALLALPQPQAVAQSSPPQCPTNVYQLTLATNPTIDKLKATDFLVRESDNTATYPNEQELLKPPEYNTSITRQLEQLWRMRVYKKDEGNLKVQYTLSGIDGKLNPFNNVDKSELLPPQGIQKTSFCPEDTDTIVVEGGVQFKFQDLSNIGTSPVRPYRGQLSVCVKRLDSNECL